MVPCTSGAHIRGTTGSPGDRLGEVNGGSGVRRAAVVVGREVELDALGRATRAAGTGSSECVFVRGEGGVGKTRLVNETTAAGHQLGLAVLAGRAPIAAPLAFSVVAEALRSWLRTHETTLHGTPFGRGLRLVLPEWDDGNDDRDRLSDAQLRLLALEGVVRLVREIAGASGGAVMLLDDLHAADPESLEAIRYLAGARIDSCLLVGALRPAESPLADELVRTLRADGVADVLDLDPLEPRAVSDLVAAVLNSEPPEPLVADIMARTDGVPILVEEVLDAHLRAGTIEVGASGTVWRGGALAVPKTVREMVDARLSKLPRAHRDVLVAAAVLGEIDVPLVAALADAPVEVVHDALDDGARLGLLEHGAGTIVFRHAIIREAVLDTALPHTVEALHLRAADALDAHPEPSASLLERRAAHLVAIDEHDAAAQLLAAAAVLRLDEHALLGAELLARDAIASAGSDTTKELAADALAKSLAAQGRWSEALDVDGDTIERHGDAPARRERMALSALEAGRPDLALEILARARAAGDASPSLDIAAGRAVLVQGDGDTALADAARAFDAATAAADLDARLHAIELRGRALDFLGRRDEAEDAWSRQADEAVAAGRTQAQLRAVVQLGKVELFAGRPPKRLYEAVELAREAGAFIELAWAEENLSIALGINGDIAGAAALLDASVARCRTLRLNDQLPYLLLGQAMTESYITDTASDALLSEAEARAATDDFRLASTAARGDLAIRRREYAAAAEWFWITEDIRRSLPGIVPIDAPCWLVLVLVALDRRDDAVQLLDDVRKMPDLARWSARPVLAEVGDAFLAADAATVDRIVTDSTMLSVMDCALLRLLAADVLRGDAQTRWLREALDFYESAGSIVMAERTRQRLRAAGGRVPRRRRATAPVPAELAKRGVTAREAEVLKLLGEGCSNAEISEQLYVSVRTVESHVSSLLTKLDARNRGRLAALSASIDFDA
jgi:DNA-binding NarL/FixJ family response regulator